MAADESTQAAIERNKAKVGVGGGGGSQQQQLDMGPFRRTTRGSLRQPYGEDFVIDWEESKDLNAMQAELVRAGFIDPGRVTPGLWGDAEREGLIQALRYSNQNGMTIDETLAVRKQFASTARAKINKSNGGSGAAPLIRLSNPNDLREVADQVAQKQIGRKLRQDELDRFIASYNAEERRTGAGNSGTVVAGQAADTAVSTFAQENLAGEYEATNVVNTIDNFVSMLGGIV